MKMPIFQLFVSVHRKLKANRECECWPCLYSAPFMSVMEHLGHANVSFKIEGSSENFLVHRQRSRNVIVKGTSIVNIPIPQNKQKNRQQKHQTAQTTWGVFDLAVYPDCQVKPFKGVTPVCRILMVIIYYNCLPLTLTQTQRTLNYILMYTVNQPEEACNWMACP